MFQGCPCSPSDTGIQGIFPCPFGKVTVHQAWCLKALMGYPRISNFVDDRQSWSWLILCLRQFLSTSHRLVGGGGCFVGFLVFLFGFCLFFLSFQILSKLVFFFFFFSTKYRCHFETFFFFFSLKKEKNPFSINLSTEYLEYIWTLHFKKSQFNAAHPWHMFVCTQAHKQVHSEGLLKKP